MPSKPRVNSPLQELAIWFYLDVLGNIDFSDKRYFRRVLGESGRLCNPKNGDIPLDPKIVRKTIEKLLLCKFGYSGAKVTSMHIVTWGNPPYYQQYLDYLNTPPPHWNLAEVKDWEKNTGRIAYPEEPATMVIVPTVPAKVFQSESF